MLSRAATDFRERAGALWGHRRHHHVVARVHPLSSARCRASRRRSRQPGQMRIGRTYGSLH